MKFKQLAAKSWTIEQKLSGLKIWRKKSVGSLEREKEEANELIKHPALAA